MGTDSQVSVSLEPSATYPSAWATQSAVLPSIGAKGALFMAAHAGETAQETGDFHCQSCNAVVHVTKGKKIPECPNGHKTYDTRTGEPGNKSS